MLPAKAMARRPGRIAADEVHFVETPDGWRLALGRYRPRQAGPGLPVILCAGYACNRRFLDYDERFSLARYLAGRGFEAWVLELRGRGLSHPGSACRDPRVWTFDDLARIDVPAAIEHVAHLTRRRVAWVGHSMGGMVLYAFLAAGAGRSPLVTGVTVASPVVITNVTSTLARSIGRVLLDLPYPETIHQRLMLGALWNVLAGSSWIGVGMNPENIDRALVGRALRRSLVNVPRRKLQQLARWAIDGVFSSEDGSTDYRAGLSRVATPLLLVAGSQDRLASPAAVGAALETLPRSCASFREIGRGQGHSADYGHVDLVFGRNAPEEVFPLIADWLDERARDAGGFR